MVDAMEKKAETIAEKIRERLADIYKQGQINDRQRERIHDAAGERHDALNEQIDALRRQAATDPAASTRLAQMLDERMRVSRIHAA